MFHHLRPITSRPATALTALLLLAPVLTPLAQQPGHGHEAEATPEEQLDEVVGRARGAQRVVVATVTDIEPMAVETPHGDRLIISRTTLAIEDSLKGNVGQTLTVDVEGGTLGELRLEVSDMPQLQPGDRGLFMVNGTGQGPDQLHLRGQGHFDLEGDLLEDTSGLTVGQVRSQLARGTVPPGQQ